MPPAGSVPSDIDLAFLPSSRGRVHCLCHALLNSSDLIAT